MSSTSIDSKHSPHQHVVLLLHGLASTSLEVARLGKFLAEHGFATYTPNIAGFCYGQPCTTWRGWVDAMRAEFRRLSGLYQSVSIVGVSMGATLALAVAQEENDIAALVLLAPALAYDGWAIPWYRPLLAIARYIPVFRRYKYKEHEPFGVKNAEMRAKIKKAVMSAQASEAGGAYIGFDHVNEADTMVAYVRKRVDLVTCPTLIVHATEDETVSPRNAEWLLENVASKRKKLVLLGQSYHMITIDNEYELVFYETQQFIKTAINTNSSTMVFEQPEVVSKALQRALRAEVD